MGLQYSGAQAATWSAMRTAGEGLGSQLVRGGSELNAGQLAVVSRCLGDPESRPMSREVCSPGTGLFAGRGNDCPEWKETQANLTRCAGLSEMADVPRTVQ